MSKKNKPIEGYIGYYNLQNWWMNEFSDEERVLIEDIYKPFGLDPNSKPLTEGKILDTTQTITTFLQTLSGWFNNPTNRHLANKIINKAGEIGKQNPDDILGNHFLYSEMVSIYYPLRNDKIMLDIAIQACKEQISIAPKAAKAFLEEYPNQPLPSHRGYEQLAIIYDKQNKHGNAISVCKQAKSEDWAGEWDKRIERYQKKMDKN